MTVSDEGDGCRYNALDQTSVAVIGISCRFPGDAFNAEGFWNLLCNGKSAFSEVPAARFNVDAFHHAATDRLNTLSTKGGHFLREDVSAFDASFFNMTTEEACATDPQQRILLEVAYEALENAGVSVKSVAGSETSCYVGCFTQDWREMIMQDTETSPKYSGTGAQNTMLSNRVSWFFDLRGPSMTIDTACSSSLVGLHLACQSLRFGESKMALVGGSNLMLSPDMSMWMSNLHFLSKDGLSKSFDASADGYGRGEGVAFVLLKPVSDAIRDGNVIRAVIRGTGINQDGKTPGITVPNSEAQAELIRSTYRAANLPLDQTGYFEAHGTGTPAGDPLELKAIAETLAHHRKAEDYILVGSVKTNIGHLEGAAGLAGLIKSILVLENGQIPATLHFRHPNPRIPFSAWRIKVASESVPWPAQGYRRVSVNSFGFGGTNAHAILDDAYHYLSARGMVGLHNTRLSDIPPQRPRSTVSEPGRMHSSGIDGSAVIAPHSTSKIFVWSAADKQSLLRLRDAFAKHLLNVQSALESPCSANQDQYLCRLAYTLSEKRSRFPWKTCVTASSISRLCEELSTESLSMNRSKHNSRTAFVFTGQGAQWAEMGVSFFQYPVFYDCIRTADSFLQSLGCSWSALEELRRKAHESNIDLPEYSQPLCTILQVALVDLLSSWNVKPSAVVGHSSGEIAAAYAAGAITRSDAWSLSFGRGGTSPKLKSLAPKTRGAMIALAVSEEKAFTIIRKITCGQVVVACINSPISVTLSGNEEAIEEVEVICKVSSIFARRLKVQQAYHSPQMEVAAPSYLEAIKDVTAKSSTQGCKMYSSVTGQFIDGSALGPSYWVQNMVSPVRFFGAVNSLLGRSTDEEFDADIGIDCLLEIGPHSTLQGPLSQILKFHSIKNLPYLSMLQRHKDGIQTSMNSMRAFFIMGAPVNIDKLNNAHVPAPISYQMLTDLPSYMWNHSRSYWHESRLSRNYRFRSQPRLDLLGAPCPDSDSSEWKWRGFLRTKDTPWIRDHEVLSSILYPAAGFIVMALEAAHQIASPEKVVQEYEFREVQIEKAAVIVDDSFGLECVLQLRPHELGASNETTLWYRFRVSTCAEGEDLQENCSGLINIKYTSTEQSALMRMERVLEHKKCVKRYEELRKSCQKSQDPVKFYSEMSAIGLAYGPTFRNITAIKTGQSGSCCTVEIPEISSTMPGGVEFPHLLHPTTLDTIFQTIFAGSRNALGQRPKAFVPTSIRSVRISARLPTTAGSTLQVFSTLQRHGLRGIEAEVYALDGLATEANIMIHGLRCSEIPMSSNVESGFRDKTHCAQVIWRPALDLLSGDQIQDLIEPKSDERMTPRQVVAMSQQAAVSLIHRTLEKVTLSQITSPHLKTFYQWMLEQEDKNANSYKRHKSAPSECSIADFEAPVNLNGNKSIDEELVWHIGTNLEKILTGHADPLQILLDKDLLYRYYKTSIGMDKMHSKLATYVGLIAHSTPSISILEVGAGFGGTTYSILSELCNPQTSEPLFSDYTFTDISPGFFERAQETLHPWSSYVKYKVLDIEDHPQSQGFQACHYGMIIAANVLHATKSIAETLTHLHYLLRPGGRLCLIDYTNPGLGVNIIYGCLPGWWKGENDGRYGGPTLSVDAWALTLQRHGFKIDLTSPDLPNAKDQQMSFIAATKEELRPANSVHVDELIVLEPANASSTSRALAAGIASTLKTKGCSVERAIWPVNATIYENKKVVSLLELENQFLICMTEEDFVGFKQLMLQASSLLWVTKASDPAGAMFTGLARSVRNEIAGTYFKVLRFSDRSIGDCKFAADIAARIALSSSDDNEFVEEDGIVSVARLAENEDMASHVANFAQGEQREMTSIRHASRPLKLDIETSGFLDSLYFRTDELSDVEIADDEVEIQVRATGLNFRDLMVSLGQIQDTKLGWEAAGIVRQVGHKVTRFKTGDRICTLYKGAHRTLVRCKGIVCQQIPDGMSFEEAASIPLTHCTVIQSLIRIAQGKEGQSILIHAAAGGVGQIAVQVAQYLKMEVFATAGSPEKRELLRTTYDVPQDHIMDSRDLSFAKGIMRMTNGRGVDCVLNSLSGEALRQTWHCIAPFGTFIEIGIKDILRNTGLDMEKFLQNTRFASVNIDRIEQTNPMLCAELMEESFQLVRQGVTKLSTHLTVYPASQIEDAFRLMQSGKHSGKIVISLDTEEPVPIWQSSKDSLVLNPDATYLIAGGLGGLGRSLATLMVEHGARNIALISRSGNLSSPAETLIDSLKERKIRVNTYACDIGDAKSLQETVQQISQDLPAVRGVVQSAMVLRDTIFENMSYQQWTEVIHPKVQGSWNLHNTFQEGLDFFIMLSSIAGVTGNMGQGNYAAGGAFQDELAHHRRSLGLPAVTIDLGYMVDVGYVAERGLSAKMKRWESFGMTEAEFHALILTVMSSGHDAPTVPAQVVTGFATGGVVNILEIARPFYFDDTRFAIAAKAGIVEGGAATLEAKPSNTIPMSIRLPQVTSLASATEVITAALIEKLAKLLQCPTMDIDASRPLHHYGVDSLVGAEIRNWLSKECGTEVPQFEVLRSVPISAFAGTVAGKSVFVKEALGQRYAILVPK